MLTQVFQRAVFNGWLILSGSSPAIDERGLVRLLEIVDSHRPVFLFNSSGETPLEITHWIEDLAALLEVELQQFDLESLDNLEGGKRVKEAGILVLAGNRASKFLEDWRAVLGFFLADGQDSIPAVLWFVGPASSSLGQWMYSSSLEECSEALNWLPGSLILQEERGLADLEPVQRLLRQQLRSYALNLVGSATIAIGPAGEIDLWGSPTPSITLGQGWGED